MKNINELFPRTMIDLSYQPSNDTIKTPFIEGEFKNIVDEIIKSVRFVDCSHTKFDLEEDYNKRIEIYEEMNKYSNYLSEDGSDMLERIISPMVIVTGNNSQGAKNIYRELRNSRYFSHIDKIKSIDKDSCRFDSFGNFYDKIVLHKTFTNLISKKMIFASRNNAGFLNIFECYKYNLCCMDSNELGTFLNESKINKDIYIIFVNDTTENFEVRRIIANIIKNNKDKIHTLIFTHDLVDFSRNFLNFNI